MIWQEYIFCALENFHPPFWVWIRSPHFTLCAFKAENYLCVFLYMKIFARVTSSGPFFSFWCGHYAHVMKSPSPLSLAADLVAHMAALSAFPQSAVSSILHIQFQVHFNTYVLPFFAALHLCSPTPSFKDLLLSSVMWVCPWEIRRQHAWL